MEINNSLIKHYLKNVMFITGTAYAGKSTMAKMLAEKYNLIHCGENYNCIPDGIVTPDKYPNICYFQTMKNWSEFLNRPPEVYENWIYSGSRELAEFEITYLLHISKFQRVIVDTNIPPDILKKIADYNQVAVMLCPASMSVENFFNRDDSDKVFLYEQIMKTANPERTLKNFNEAIALINSQEHYDKWTDSGFFTVVRKDATTDTKLETLEILAQHFGLTAESKPWDKEHTGNDVNP
ncbi:MAG: hypothetical protein FWG72_04190 [Oscillospiraceae bacterium]|nr:hypothetical protein [Oscillospiraceae bacterium]